MTHDGQRTVRQMRAYIRWQIETLGKKDAPLIELLTEFDARLAKKEEEVKP